MFNNENGLYEPAPEVENGLWLEQDRDSGLFDENGPYLFIITDDSDGSISENEGPDHVKYVKGPHAGQYVIDVLNGISRTHNDKVNPSTWEPDGYWESLGFSVIPGHLKRFTEEEGYYHA